MLTGENVHNRKTQIFCGIWTNYSYDHQGWVKETILNKASTIISMILFLWNSKQSKTVIYICVCVKISYKRNERQLRRKGASKVWGRGYDGKTRKWIQWYSRLVVSLELHSLCFITCIPHCVHFLCINIIYERRPDQRGKRLSITRSSLKPQKHWRF